MKTQRFPLLTGAALGAWALLASASCMEEMIGPAAQADIEHAFAAALDDYAAERSKAAAFELGEIHVEGAFAYAVGRAEDGEDQPLILALDAEQGWYAVAPTLARAAEYNALLDAFPESILDEATKAYLHVPDVAAKANFTGHELPWPAGRNAYVPKKEAAGHTNQIDFNIHNTDAIYATKAGTVVFVKQSSNANCLVAPPDPCWKKANMVVIQHGPAEYSWYVHVAHNSVPVQVGTYVGAGTMIAQEGNTGYSSGKHLHYMASTGHTAWTNPADPNNAPWATGFTQVDFDESPWSGLHVGWNYKSRNTTDPGVTSWGSGRIDLFAQGENNALYHRAFNGAWGGWTSLGGTLTSGPDAASWGSGHMDVFVRGVDNNVYYRRYSGGWSGWQPAGAPPGGATSDPAAASRGAGQMDLFVRGGDNALWWRSYAGGGWSAWQSLGGTLVGGPDATSWGNGHVDVYARGVDNQLYYRRYQNGSWSGWLGLGRSLSADPSATSRGWNTLNLFYRGTGKDLWHVAYDGAWGAWESLGGFLTSSPDAASWGPGHLDVFVRGDDNNIYHRWQLNSPWSAWESLGQP